MIFLIFARGHGHTQYNINNTIKRFVRNTESVSLFKDQKLKPQNINTFLCPTSIFGILYKHVLL